MGTHWRQEGHFLLPVEGTNSKQIITNATWKVQGYPYAQDIMEAGARREE